jgi:hypothetical protein
LIDLNFERYSELTFTNLHLLNSYEVQQWIHCIVGFSAEEMPTDLKDPEALVILNKEKQILQVVLYEEGCDSPNYQFTDNEKQQITAWLSSQKITK